MKNTYYQLPHIRLAALEYHATKAEETIVLAVHGWLDNASSFSPMMLHNDSHHVIAIDWPGHGYSEHRGVDASYHLLDYVYDIYALIEHNGWKKVHIVGHSLGAIVASIFAGTFPELVDKLVLIEALGPISSAPENTRELLKKSLVGKYQAQLKLPSNKSYNSIDKAILARTLVSDFDSDIARILVERSLQQVGEGFVWRSDSRLKQLSPMRMVEEQAVDLLSGIEQDTLLVLGETGYQSLRTQLSKRMAVVPNLDVQTLYGGHHLHMENPKSVWQLIKSHLSDV